MGRKLGSKNLKEAQKAIHVYIPETLYNFIKNKNKSEYVRTLIQKDYKKKGGVI